MQENDIVLLPNLPDPGTFSLCRLRSGSYDFHPISMDGEDKDCDHIRPAELIRGCEGIPNDNPAVKPGIHRTLRCRSRLWRIDHLEKEVRALCKAAVEGTSFVETKGAQIRFIRLLGEVNQVHRDARHEARQRIREQLTIERLRDIARAEDLEEPLVRILHVLFPPPALVDRTGGAGENGADIVVRIHDPFDPEEDALILIQLKDHDGVTDDDGLTQLKTAIRHYGHGTTKQGRVIEAVFATLANSFAPDVAEQARLLQEQTEVKVRLINGTQLLDIVAYGLWQNALLLQLLDVGFQNLLHIYRQAFPM